MPAEIKSCSITWKLPAKDVIEISFVKSIHKNVSEKVSVKYTFHLSDDDMIQKL